MWYLKYDSSIEEIDSVRKEHDFDLKEIHIKGTDADKYIFAFGHEIFKTKKEALKMLLEHLESDVESIKLEIENIELKED
jgi:hypothetical protein